MKANVKEKLARLADGAKEKIKGLNKKAVIAVCAVLILSLAVLANFLLIPTGGKKSGLDVALDLSDVSKAIAEKEDSEGAVAQGTKSTDAFAEMSLTRKQARDEAMEVLTAVAQSGTAVESMKEEAAGEIKQIAKDIESEANIESLVKSKGFEQCVAVVNGDTASIVVKTEGLLENEVAQISEIVYQQAGVLPNNLNIIEAE